MAKLWSESVGKLCSLSTGKAVTFSDDCCAVDCPTDDSVCDDCTDPTAEITGLIGTCDTVWPDTSATPSVRSTCVWNAGWANAYSDVLALRIRCVDQTWEFNLVGSGLSECEKTWVGSTPNTTGCPPTSGTHVLTDMTPGLAGDFDVNLTLTSP